MEACIVSCRNPARILSWTPRKGLEMVDFNSRDDNVHSGRVLHR